MKTVICDNRLPQDAQDALQARGFNLILLPPSPQLPAPLASHTDMLIFTHGGRIITEGDYLRQNREIFDKIEKMPYNIHVSESDGAFGSKYPADCILNALVIGDKLFVKTGADCAVKALAKAMNMKIINVNQGYPACTVLPLGEKNAITADCGMARSLTDAGISVCQIRNTDAIRLPPYEHGFIGGCAGIHNGAVYFVGDISAHTDFEKIADAILNAGMSYISLIPGCGCLFDVGGLRFFD